MDNEERATFLRTLATRIRDAGSDHLKLSSIADDLDAKAVAPTDPEIPPVPEPYVSTNPKYPPTDARYTNALNPPKKKAKK